MSAGARNQELRVLSGLHAGARCPLPDGEAAIGADPDCDVVLADEGIALRQARLSAQDGRWQLLPAEGGAAGIALVPGTAVFLGPVAIAVDAVNAPWPAVPDAPAQAAAEEAAPPAEAPSGTAPAPTPDTRPEFPAPARAQARRGLPAWPLALLVLAGVAAIAVALVTAPARQPAPARDPGTAAATPPTDGAAALAQRAEIARIAAQLGLAADRMSVEPGAGRLRVKAVLLKDEDAEALSAALARLTPAPELRVLTESDLRQAMQEAVEREASALQVTLRLVDLGGGRFRLEGAVPDDAQAQGVVSRLREQFGEARGIESALLTPQGQGARLLSQLRADGYAAQGRWQDGKLQIEVPLAPAELPRWEAALARAAQRHPVPLSATVTLAAANAAPGSGAVSLPFRIQSIVSGTTAFVVLEDGTRLLEGGSAQGWQLVSVELRRVVFERAGQRRVEVAR